MVTPVGGLRARFLLESVRLQARGILEQLGWFESVDSRQDVTLLDEPAAWDEPVPINAVAVAPGRIPPETEAEIGSSLAIRTWTVFIDFFAENESIGMHLINDLRDAFAGNMPSIGYSSRFIPIYNFLHATPPELGRAEVTSLTSETPPPATDSPWRKHLHVLILELEDTYGSDTD